jgi:hypothetical protein
MIANSGSGGCGSSAQAQSITGHREQQHNGRGEEKKGGKKKEKKKKNTNRKKLSRSS